MGARIVLLIGLFAVPASAQAPELYEFEGVWRYTDGQDGERRIEQAVERAIGDLPFFIEPIARDRMRARIYAHQRIDLRARGAQLFLSADRWGPVSSEVGGPAVRVVGPEGDRLRFEQWFENGRLVQRFSHPDGVRVNTFALSGDRRWLWLTVRVTSPRLPGVAEYRLRYRRAGSTQHASNDRTGP